MHPPTGTINCLAVDVKGDISGTTTTSGLAWKIAGRVGDSPVIGAGLYVDNDIGAAGSTGRGEENIKIAGGHTIVEMMRKGMSPTDACLEAQHRVARNYKAFPDRLKKIDIVFYAVNKNGSRAGGGSASARWSRSAADIHHAGRSPDIAPADGRGTGPGRRGRACPGLIVIITTMHGCCATTSLALPAGPLELHPGQLEFLRAAVVERPCGTRRGMLWASAISSRPASLRQVVRFTAPTALPETG